MAPETSETSASETSTSNGTTGRARRLRAMSALQVAAGALCALAITLPWYHVQIPGGRAITPSGQLVQIAPMEVSASGWQIVHNGSTSPFCPQAATMWGLPTSLAFVLAAVLATLLAVLLRSVIASAAGAIAGWQAVRHLALMSGTVVGAPEGCIIGEISAGWGRGVYVISLTATVVLSTLIAAQVWTVRQRERRDKIAQGLPVPPTLVEMIQNRIIGLGAAIVAESQRR